MRRASIYLGRIITLLFLTVFFNSCFLLYYKNNDDETELTFLGFLGIFIVGVFIFTLLGSIIYDQVKRKRRVKIVNSAKGDTKEARVGIYAGFLAIIIFAAILIGMFRKCTSSSGSNHSNKGIETSSGYSTDPDYKPTIDDNGDYHTINGDAKQQQYQGSQEQKKDLEEMDKRGW